MEIPFRQNFFVEKHDFLKALRSCDKYVRFGWTPILPSMTKYEFGQAPLPPIDPYVLNGRSLSQIKGERAHVNDCFYLLFD